MAEEGFRHARGNSQPGLGLSLSHPARTPRKSEGDVILQGIRARYRESRQTRVAPEQAARHRRLAGRRLQGDAGPFSMTDWVPAPHCGSRCFPVPARSGGLRHHLPQSSPATLPGARRRPGLAGQCRGLQEGGAQRGRCRLMPEGPGRMKGYGPDGFLRVRQETAEIADKTPYPPPGPGGVLRQRPHTAAVSLRPVTSRTASLRAPPSRRTGRAGTAPGDRGPASGDSGLHSTCPEERVKPGTDRRRLRPHAAEAPLDRGRRHAFGQGADMLPDAATSSAGAASPSREPPTALGQAGLRAQ
jgi:hypothetical protein